MAAPSSPVNRPGVVAGLVTRWQGCAVAIIFLIALFVIHRLADFVRQPLPRRIGEVVVALIVAAILVLAFGRRTSSGWRWRWDRSHE